MGTEGTVAFVANFREDSDNGEPLSQNSAGGYNECATLQACSYSQRYWGRRWPSGPTMSITIATATGIRINATSATAVRINVTMTGTARTTTSGMIAKTRRTAAIWKRGTRNIATING